MINEVLFTIAGTGLQVLLGFTERDALPIVTPAVIHTRCVVISVYRRWTLTAVALHVEGKNTKYFLKAYII